MNFPSSVTVTDQIIDLTHLTDGQKDSYVSLANDISRAFSESGKLRMIFGFAGVSGAGKSTLTAIIKRLLPQGVFRTEQLSIDAYHYNNGELDARKLLAHKGRYDTYNVDLLLKDLNRFKEGSEVSFPEYSRKTHESVPHGGSLWNEHESGILLVEGLWILYTDGDWNQVKTFVDVSYFVDENPSKTKERTIARHVRGGRPQNEAEVFYKESDAMNAKMVLKTRHLANRFLKIG